MKSQYYLTVSKWKCRYYLKWTLKSQYCLAVTLWKCLNCLIWTVKMSLLLTVSLWKCLLVNVNSEKVSVLFSSNSLRVPVLLISWVDLCFVGFLWTAYIFKWVAEYYSYLHLFSQLYFNRKWVIPLKLYFRGYCPKELRSKGVFIIKQTWIN